MALGIIMFLQHFCKNVTKKIFVAVKEREEADLGGGVKVRTWSYISK